jgi:Dolichyl-phosphate-mannose-protein mannosyltransferase
LDQPKKSVVPGLYLLAAYALLLCLAWGKFKLLGLTCALMAAAVWAWGRMYSGSVPPVLSTDDEKRASGRWAQILFGCAGLFCGWMASQAGIAGHFLPLALWIILSAVAWRAAVLEPLPAPKGAALTVLVLALVALGALFRLYQAGAVPVGACSSDEFGIWTDQVWPVFDGLRFTYTPHEYGGADGVIPVYMLAAGLKVFGSSLLGYRMEGILCGILMTWLFYRLAKEGLGVWAGLAAAFFWAVSLWSVTVTRANYYMAETLLWAVACMTLLTLGLRKGGAWRFAAAGLCWAFCFNVYPAVRVLLVLIPWLYCLLWFSDREARQRLQRSTHPLLAGFAVGIAPIALWMVSGYPDSLSTYFSALYSGHQAGTLASTSLLGKIDEVLARVLGAFPGRFSLLTQGGFNEPYLFAVQYPMLHPWLFTLAVVGFGMAVARFRNAFYAFLLYWWFIGFLPCLASYADTGTALDRRMIMILPPTLLMAAVGADTVARVGRALLGRSRAAAMVLAAACVAAASVYGLDSYRDYFDRNQRDAALMSAGFAPYAVLFRRLHADIPADSLLVTTVRDDDGSFLDAGYDDRIEQGYSAMVRGLNVFHYQGDPYSFDPTGFSHALDWAMSTKPGTDVWILLMPFYDYLEPGLKDIGAEVVERVAWPLSSDGPLAGGIDDSPAHFATILRIRDLNQAQVDRYSRRPVFGFELRELIPPQGWTRDQVRALNSSSDARYEPLVRAYKEGAWSSSGRTARFTTDDPWFWTASESLPGGIGVPYSLRFRAVLSIPRDGNYAFGASTTVLTKIEIDGKKVFERDPLDPAEVAAVDWTRPDPGLTWLPDEADRRGVLGPLVHLSKGDHVVEISQAFLSRFRFTQVLRPVWRPEGRQEETLPLEALRPLR